MVPRLIHLYELKHHDRGLRKGAYGNNYQVCHIPPIIKTWIGAKIICLYKLKHHDRGL